VTSLIERMGKLPSQYLAHEYINGAWAPCFHADVAAALADARLEWVGSVNLVENFPELTLTDEQRAVAQRFDDPLLRELVKDACLDRSLRHDVFVRGARRMNPRMRDAALMDLSLALNMPPEDMPFEAEMPAGRASLSRDFYGPITKAMAGGPCRVGDLLSLPSLQGKRDNPAELIGVLVGLDLAEPTLRSGAAPTPQAMRFNRSATTKLVHTENLGRPIAAASNALGTGAPCTLFDLYVLDRVLQGEGEEDTEHWVHDLGLNLDEEGRNRLRDVLGRCLRVRLPILRAAGVF
jgi:predicted methyltransferase family protein